MNARDINQTFDLIGYVESIVPLRKSSSYWITTEGCPIPGCTSDNDAFNIKQTATGYIWICRKCNPDRYHSSIDFYMRYKNIDFKQALQELGGSLEKPTRAQPAPIRKHIYDLPPRQWQAEAWKVVDAASDCLMESPKGAPGRAYLESRGLTPSTWGSLLLGYGMAWDSIGKINRPAIFIPWMSSFDEIAAVKYRFIDEIAAKDKGRRFTCKAGSKQYIYNLLHVVREHENLLVVEGELNAASIHQVAPANTSVISIGGDTNTANGLVKSLAARFKRVFVWMDDANKNPLPGAKVIQSPVVDGVKFDANQILQAGVLPAFIASQVTGGGELVTE